MRMHNYTKEKEVRVAEFLPQDIEKIDWNLYNTCCWKAEVYFIHCDITRTVPFGWITGGFQKIRACKKFETFLCYYTPNAAAHYANGYADYNVKHTRKFNRTGAQYYTVEVLKILAIQRNDLPDEEPVIESAQERKQKRLISQTESYKEKLTQALEKATDQSAETRVIALHTIAEILSHRFLPEFAKDHKFTIMDILRESIRRGKSAEQSLAAQIVSMLVLQLGGGDKVAKELGSLLLVTALNQSNGLDVRAKCCSGLGLLNFLGSEDIGDIVLLMRHLESIFSGSYANGEKTPCIISAEASALHCAALSAWGLLLTLIPSGIFCNLFKKKAFAPSMTNLIGMLQSQHLDVRTTVGEAIALVLESGRHHNADFQEAYLTEIFDATKQLATDSNKYRAKRDLKTQRATFRDVLRYLEANESPNICIHFGTETLQLDTWAIHNQYIALCAIIGPGMTSHLAENDFLRHVLQLSPKLVQPAGAAVAKEAKLEQKLLNAATFKARTSSRSHKRDKRSAVIA